MTRAFPLVLAIGLGLVGCRKAADTPSPRADVHTEQPAAGAHDEGADLRIEEGMLRDLRITTATVESRRGDEQVNLLGELAVDEAAYAEVGAPVPSRVIRLRAGIGDPVRRGQPLLDLQSTDVGQARGAYLTAAARLSLAESALARKRGLAAERIAPQREVQEAEAEAAGARAAVRAASAALSAMGLTAPDEEAVDASRSGLFMLPSPVAGTVIDRRAVQGQMLEPGTAAFRVANLSTLWLTVHAFERDALRIRTGTPARVTFSGVPGQTFPGRVVLVGRQVSSESRTIDVRITVANRDGVLRPGMSATAAVAVGVSDTPILAVPVAAVQRVRERWCVFVPKSGGVFEIREIGRGRDLGTEVEVLSGLQADETIVVDGAFLLKAQAEKSEAGHDDH